MIRGVVIIEGSPEGMAKEFGQLVRKGLFELVENWHKRILPHHFEPAAERRYLYAPRTIKYLRYKAKRRPMAGPLEFSGQSKKELTQMIRVSGTAKRATGAMSAPRYFWMRPAGSNHPDMSEEATTVTLDETNAMAQRLNERVTAQLNLLKDRKIYR
jgi:hypothetical protein